MFMILVTILKRIKIIHVKWFTKQKVKSTTLQNSLDKRSMIHKFNYAACNRFRHIWFILLQTLMQMLSSFSIVINDLLLWIGKRNSGPLQNVTQILSSMKSSIYSMLTLRKLLLEDADAESECCSFLERSSNKNSSWGAWSCTIVVSFTANTETERYNLCKTSK